MAQITWRKYCVPSAKAKFVLFAPLSLHGIDLDRIDEKHFLSVKIAKLGQPLVVVYTIHGYSIQHCPTKK